MPDAAVQVNMDTQTLASTTRRPLKDSTQKKYDQAVKRLIDAGLDLSNAPSVLAYLARPPPGEEKPLSESAQKQYLSAIKQYMSRKNLDFPKEYQVEIDRLYHRQSEKETEQNITEKQKANFLPYTTLLRIQQKLQELPDKTDKQWMNLLVASLYTLNAPVRADYGDMVVVKKSSPKKGNQLVWGQKTGARFIFKEYKTAGDYGDVSVPVSPELHKVIEDWFGHLGKTPKYLLGEKTTPNNLLVAIANAFGSRTQAKHIGINLLRHAYITHMFPTLDTIKKKDDLARRMLHSRARQELYVAVNAPKEEED